jgi:hypothetical protein
MDLKYFDAFEGVWMDISGQPGASLEYNDVSGWVTTGGYKKYIAKLNQDSTNPPVAIILENTLGFEPNWSYYDAGIYGFDWDEDFNPDKCIIYLGPTANSNKPMWITYNDIFNITLNTENQNSRIIDTTLEIRYYN